MQRTKTMTDRGSSERVIAWLRERSNLLLLSHERPDGDAYGSMFGLLLGLKASGRSCALYLKEPLPRGYRRLFPPLDEVFTGERCPQGDFDGVVCLDVTGKDRVDGPPSGAFPPDMSSVCALDHHPDSAWGCEAKWVAPDRASTAQIVAHIVREAGWGITPEAATCLLTGLVTDTGGFRFDNTDANALREAARLIDEGAQHTRIMREMFLRKPLGRGLLEGRLLRNARFHCDGRLVLAVLDRALLDEFGVSSAELEGVVDTLKGVDGVDIACLLQPDANDVRLSIRSTNPDCPVNGIARQLGGGGHPLAAGATAEGVTLQEAEQKFVELGAQVLGCPDSVET